MIPVDALVITGVCLYCPFLEGQGVNLLRRSPAVTNASGLLKMTYINQYLLYVAVVW